MKVFPSISSLIRKLNTLPKIRSPCQGYHAREDRDLDTMYYQWVPFFLLFQAREKKIKFFFLRW